MQQEQFNFEDAELRDTLKRAFPKMAAPQSLRAAIEKACDQATGDVAGASTEPIPLTRRFSWGFSQWLARGRKMAIAASIAGLGLGIGLFVVLDRAQQIDQNQYVSTNRPVPVETALVQHNELQRGAADPRIRQRLLGYPQLRDSVRGSTPLHVPNPDLSRSGWEFIGAKPCQMPGSPAAQLFYTRGPQTLSVFVLPHGNLNIDLRNCPKGGYLYAKRASARATLLAIACAPDGKLSQGEVDAIAEELASR